MTGNVGLTNAASINGIQHGISSADGEAVGTNQLQLMTEAERADFVGATINKQSEFNAGFIAWAEAQAAQHGTTLGAFLTELKRIGTYTTSSEGAISREWIKADTVASVDYFTTTSPYATNDLATLGTATDISVSPLNNHNPANDDVLGGIALPSGEIEFDNAGSGNNTGDSLNWRRVVMARFHFRAWRNGSTEPIIGYGERGSSSTKANIVHAERADAEGNMYLNFQLSNGTAQRFGIFARTGSGGLNGPHFQLGDVVDVAVENHKTSFSAADSATALELVVVARVFRNGTLVDEIQFNDSTGMAMVDHYDYGRVYIYGGNSAQTDVSAVAHPETWQNVTTIPAAQFLRHSQLLTALSHRPTSTSKLGGFWSGAPVDTFNIPANIRSKNVNITGNLQFNGEDAKPTDLGALADYTFDVRSSTHSDIVQNCYVVQPEDHGQLIAINPNSTVVFVILPQSLWTTEYNFKCSVTLDASNTGLVRVACPHIIGRPNNTSGNAESWVKANTASSGLPTALRYPNAQAAAANYSGYDFFDLWWARDWADFNMVNRQGWCGTAIRWFEAFQPQANPAASETLTTQRTTSTFNLTNPTRSITVTKFRPVWSA